MEGLRDYEKAPIGTHGGVVCNGMGVGLGVVIEGGGHRLLKNSYFDSYSRLLHKGWRLIWHLIGL
jgi:hypothetical protein